MSELAFASPILAPVEGSSSLTTTQALAGVTCLYCGKLFSLSKGLNNRVYHKKWCSKKCAKHAEYERLVGITDYPEINCCVCGKKHKPRLAGQKTCGSRLCQYEVLKTRMRERSDCRTAKNMASIETKPCIHCGGSFKPRTIQKQLIYCSKQCKLDARTIRRRPARIEKSCIVCGAKFNTGINHQKTCSKKCIQKRTRNLLLARMTPRAIQTRIANALRGRVVQALKRQGLVKTETTFKLCGCSKEFLFNHLEKQFADGMSWENWSYNGWHIDHIIPCSSFDLSLIEDRKKCFHWSNLQPLWRKDNQQKNNRLDWKPSRLVN